MKKAVNVLPQGQGHVSKWKKYIKSEQCYHNALLIADLMDCEYIEGWVHNGYEWIQHAWNSYNGQEFDLTYQIHVPRLMGCPRKTVIKGNLCTLISKGFYLNPEYKTLIEQNDLGLVHE